MSIISSLLRPQLCVRHLLNPFTCGFSSIGGPADNIPGSEEKLRDPPCWTPGPKKPSNWWPIIVPSDRRITRFYPVRQRHRTRISLVREGCTNRPFYTIQIKSNLQECKQPGAEQVGSWDPLPNKDHGEQMIALNLDRISYWIGRGAQPTRRVTELLGLAGFYPVSPHSYLCAYRARKATIERLKKEKEQSEPKAMNEADPEGDTSEEPDPNARPDAVWRRKFRDPRWWRHGLF